MKVTGETRIFKDDRGIYKISICNKEINANGEEESIFMRIHVGFRKGQEVKNKTKINIKDGFLTFFRMKTEEINEKGNPIYKRYPKLIVLDYEVLEEGIDEVQKSKNYFNTKSNLSDDTIGGYSSSDDELPF